LSWIVCCYYKSKLSELEFEEIFDRLIQNYGANVNYHNTSMVPFMIDALYEYFNDIDQYDSFRTLSELQSWSHRFYFAVDIYMRNNGNINVQNVQNLEKCDTMLSLLCETISDMDYDDGVEFGMFHPLLYDLCAFLLRHGAKTEKGYCLENGWKPLHYVCDTGNVRLVQLFLDLNCRTNHRVPIRHVIRSKRNRNDGHRTTAFHVVDVNKDHFLPVVKVLTEFGGDINCLDCQGIPILHNCFRAYPGIFGWCEPPKMEDGFSIAQKLLQYGADINCQDWEGNTILHYVVSYQRNHNINVMRFLLYDCHADYLTVKNRAGRTVWEIECGDYINKGFHVIMEQKRYQQIYASLLFSYQPTGFIRR
jgi:Ankyrin repeats (many copies)